MPIIVTVISILVITGFVWLLNRLLPFRICPICAGVSGTWLWILAGMYSGWLETESWQLVAAMLIGGSVVGIAYQIEKHLPADRSPLLWKTLFIPAGFVAAASALASRWLTFGAAALTLFVLPLIFLNRSEHSASATWKTIKEKLKDCCS
ncbi:hypothetical protein HYW30_02015 [Candidatus Azambacteria bacterium]|nr:hypothetical protein [Candidatus Azambacteria bacterium]